MKLNGQGSFFCGFVLLDVEVLDLVGFLVLGDHVQELTQTVLFQVFLGEVLEVPFREGSGGIYADFGAVVCDFDLVS